MPAAMIYSWVGFPVEVSNGARVLAPGGGRILPGPRWLSRTAPSARRASCSPGSTSSPTLCGRWGCARRWHRGLLPNGGAALEVYLAALQGGWYYTPINWHFTAPEIAYIVADCEAKAFFVHERYAAAGTAAADLAGVPASARLGYGCVPGFMPGRGPAGRAACHHARGPHGGVGHALHLGDHRAAPRASAASSAGLDPDEAAELTTACCNLRRSVWPAERAPGHLAELSHRGDLVRRRGHSPGPHAGVHGRLGLRDRAGPRVSGTR